MTFGAQDEHAHAPSEHPSYSESVYFNFVDDECELAGLMRIGNRPNSGHGEVTVLVYLPDGRAAFRFAKPEIDVASFHLEGFSVDVIEPLQRVRLRYFGDVHVLADGTALADPRTAFASSPVQELALDLDFDGLMPVTGWKVGSPEATIDPGGAFAPSHYEAACRVTGELVLDGRKRQVRGQGLRDHSWGPRDWDSPQFYRWISCFSPSGDGFVVWLAQLDGRRQSWGFLRAGDDTHPVHDLTIESGYDTPAHLPTSTTVRFTAGGERVETRGVRVAVVPLRHRGNGTVVRLSEVVFRFEGFRGATGQGIAEFHDLMINGVPSGMGEA